MKKKRTFLIIFSAVACVASVIARYAQFNAAIDFDTGFFYYDAVFLKYLYYIILGASIAGVFFLAVTEKKRKTRFFTKKMGHFDETDVALCGIMFLLAAFSVLYTAYVAGFGSVGAAGIMTGLLGAAAYGFSGAVLLIRKRVLPAVGLSFLGLSVYYVIRLIHFFLENYIILHMSEYLIRLVTTTLLALFYLSAGRMLLRAENRTTRFKACVFGFSAAILILSETVAKLIYWFGSPSIARQTLSSSKFLLPNTQTAAEAIALITFLLCAARYRPERVKNGGETN